MKTQKGFTLVEVLLAATILTVLVVSVGVLVILSIKVNAASGDQTECVALAQQQLESLRHVDYDALSNGGSLEIPQTDYHQYVDTNDDHHDDFLVTWKVQYAGVLSGSLSTSKLHVAQLDARCRSLRSSTGQLGNPKVVTFTTYRARGTER